jgi:nicotinate-nucleotide--dimethylbenzimidazole phosphoribosyltransferase
MLDKKLLKKAQLHIDNLTKPQGSLGKLEEIAKQIYAVYRGQMPETFRKRIYVFAGDHGVCEEGISLFPQEVTAQMVYNFLGGGAGINVFSKLNNVDVKVVDSGVKHDFEKNPMFIDMKIRKGTNNILKESAMTIEECRRCIDDGRRLARESAEQGINLIAAGEMGIGNTTPSSVLFAKFLNMKGVEIAGPGTGLSPEKISHKAVIIDKVLKRITDISDPSDILAQAGGFEIAHIAGLAIGAYENNIPFMVDGFISTAAVLCAIKIKPDVKDVCIFSHNSAEPFYKEVMKRLKVSPLLDLGFRLGEGTGAVLAMNLVEAAAEMFNNMATFESANVSEV